jgi:hypothetical protein
MKINRLFWFWFRNLRQYEQHLANLALESTEASNTLSSCLFELYNWCFCIYILLCKCLVCMYVTIILFVSSMWMCSVFFLYYFSICPEQHENIIDCQKHGWQNKKDIKTVILLHIYRICLFSKDWTNLFCVY